MLTRTVFDIQRCSRADAADDDLFAAMFDAVMLLGSAVRRQFSTGRDPWRTCVLVLEEANSLLSVSTWHPDRVATIDVIVSNALVAPNISIAPILDVLGSDSCRQIARTSTALPQRPRPPRLPTNCPAGRCVATRRNAHRWRR